MTEYLRTSKAEDAMAQRAIERGVALERAQVPRAPRIFRTDSDQKRAA